MLCSDFDEVEKYTPDTFKLDFVCYFSIIEVLYFFVSLSCTCDHSTSKAKMENKSLTKINEV